MAQRIDITGMRFGKLVAVRYRYTNRLKQAVWECKCDCGKTHLAPAKDLRSGNTKSCGCTRKENAQKLKFKDGRRKERLYGVWSTMMKRCYCKTSKVYKYYGGKGVAVCDEWKEYENFKRWAYANGYDENAERGDCTIDRINYHGNYEPSNCRWVSMEVQRKNKSVGVNPYRDAHTGRYTSKPVSEVTEC